MQSVRVVTIVILVDFSRSQSVLQSQTPSGLFYSSMSNKLCMEPYSSFCFCCCKNFIKIIVAAGFSNVTNFVSFPLLCFEIQTMQVEILCRLLLHEMLWRHATLPLISGISVRVSIFKLLRTSSDVSP